MAITFLHKKGTSSENDVYTGKKGEITVQTDADDQTARVHDGNKAGGHELARKDLCFTFFRKISPYGSMRDY